MALETGTYISDLVASNPTGTDPKSQGDDHLRLLKATIKATFPNIAGAVTASHGDVNGILGLSGFTTGNYVRKSAGALEQRTPAQVRADIGADNASNLSSGTVADARLSSNVPLKNAANVHTAASQFPTIELGHASDTTLSRIDAGRVAVEGEELSRIGATEVITGIKTFSNDSLTRFTRATGIGNNGDGQAVMLYDDRTDRYGAIGYNRGSASTRIGLSFYASYDAAPVERMRLTPEGQLWVDYLGTRSFNTQAHTVAPATTAAQVRHADGGLYDVGLNVMPLLAITSSFTFGRVHVGKVLVKGEDTARTLTLPASSDTSIPLGATINLVNNGTGAITLAPGSGVTFNRYEGTGAPDTGTHTLAQGGVATLYRASAATWYVWGNVGLS